MLTEDQIIELLAILTCPITNESMNDPVLAEDENIYEKQAITKWLQTNPTSPLTRDQMDARRLIPKPEIKRVTQILKSILESGDLVMDEEDEEDENIGKRGRVAEKNKEINSLIVGNQDKFADRVSQQFFKKYNEFKLNASVFDQIPKPTGFFPVNVLMAFFSYNGKIGVRLDNLVTYLDGKPVSNDSPLYICLFRKDEDMMRKLQGDVEEIKTRSIPLGTVRDFILRTQETEGKSGIRDINYNQVYDPYNHEITPNKIIGNHNIKSTLKLSDDPNYSPYIVWTHVPYVEKKAKKAKKAKHAGGGRRRTQRRYKKTKGKRQKSKRRNHKTRRNHR